jgi:hypothetical protein
MQEWFFVKNDFVAREDIKGIIQCPIWSRFGIKRPSTALGNNIQACQAAFNTICTYISTRDLVQEHIVYKVWPLASGWEMPKETAVGSSEGGLVYLKYTFKYRSQFDEPNDDWMDAIEATSDELLGAYSRAEDDAMSTAFGGRRKKRLNRVFDFIRFVYPDFCYPSRKQRKKRKTATSAISSTPKPKKVMVLTHRPKRIETAKVPRPTEGSSFVSELSRSDLAEAGTKSAGESELKTASEQPKVLSPLREMEPPRASKIHAATPRRRRMASVLYVVMESMKVQTPALAPDTEGETIKKSDEAGVARATSEAGPSAPGEAQPSGTAPIVKEKENVPEKLKSPVPEAPTEELDFIVRHASGKQLSEEQIAEARQYARDLKYPQGSLVYNDTDEGDFLYCLPDNKEMSVCREMMRNKGFPKLELGLSAMSKDAIADSLAYNSLKVYIFLL